MAAGKAMRRTKVGGWLVTGLLALGTGVRAETDKPVLHGRQWVAISGRPLATAAGARIFQQGGNAVDAACGMLAGRDQATGAFRVAGQVPGRGF